MTLSPVILMVYNRPYHTQRVLEALKKCELSIESDLYIFSDAAKSEEQKNNVEEVRRCISGLNGFKNTCIHHRENNLGLANNIINSVDKIISEYGKAIVLEDDLICSSSFLLYMNKALEKYRDTKQVFSVSAYTPAYLSRKLPVHYPYDAYLNYRNSSWGWATWADRWKQVDWDVRDFDQFIADKSLQKKFNRGGDDLSDMLIAQQEGKINSWAIRFSYAHFKHEAVSLCPTRSLISNIGFDGSGTNCRSDILMKNDNHLNALNDQTEFTFPKEIEVDEKIMRAFRWGYSRSLYKRIKNKINRYLLSKA